MTYRWPLKAQFVGRTTELARLETWWKSSDLQPIALIGRRRVGKSWLFRRFADGKPATILVAEQLPPGTQLSRFAEDLEGLLGVKPDLRDVPTLFRVLFRAARTKKLLIVVDEFPSLLGTDAEARQVLSGIQAVMEDERKTSKLKLVLCGSNVSVMETLFSEGSPMHGRLQNFEIRPLQFGGAKLHLPSLGPIQSFERFAVAGGMPLYLSRLGTGSLDKIVCQEILTPGSPLWNEGRAIIDQELREPRMYFGILEQLARGEKEIEEIATPLRTTSKLLSPYLTKLGELRIIGRSLPFGASETGRGGHWRINDNFLRFWFRFVFPYQAQLESGLRPADLYDAEIRPALAEHVAPAFEYWSQEWLRAHYGASATRIGRWWGNSANEYRKSGERQSEEVDAVGTAHGSVSLVSESKWTAKQLDRGIVRDLDTFKIPALRESGFRFSPDLKIVLFSKSGYTKNLFDLAASEERLVLVDVGSTLSSLV